MLDPQQLFAPKDPVCFLSPHLDDVALSCGHFLVEHPGATVLTVFAGAPPIDSADGWNARTTGERYAPAALDVRRGEDAAALALLRAEPRWLDLWEAEYLSIPFGSPSSVRWLTALPHAGRFALARILGSVRARSSRFREPIARDLRHALDDIGPASVVAPLGLHHADHRAVSAACLSMAKSSPLDWYLYLDLPYGQNFPREVTKRLARVRSTVRLLTLDPVPLKTGVKAAAVDAYASQVGRLETGFAKFDRALSEPEQYWRIGPA